MEAAPYCHCMLTHSHTEFPCISCPGHQLDDWSNIRNRRRLFLQLWSIICRTCRTTRQMVQNNCLGWTNQLTATWSAIRIMSSGHSAQLKIWWCCVEYILSALSWALLLSVFCIEINRYTERQSWLTRFPIVFIFAGEIAKFRYWLRSWRFLILCFMRIAFTVVNIPM